MTPRQVSTYKPPRNRRELVVAILGVVAVVAFTVGMLFLLAPSDETTPIPTPVPSSLPADSSLPTDSTLPPASADPGTTATSVPAG